MQEVPRAFQWAKIGRLLLIVARLGAVSSFREVVICWLAGALILTLLAAWY